MTHSKNALLNGIRDDKVPDKDGARLVETSYAKGALQLLCGVPPWIVMKDVVGLLHVDPRVKDIHREEDGATLLP